VEHTFAVLVEELTLERVPEWRRAQLQLNVSQIS
jgi:hypothetical protein